MIGIVNFGGGNVGSLKNALSYLEIECMLSFNPDDLSHCQGLILPGVGAFRPAMKKLTALGLVTFLQNWADDRRPLMGICLGMQLLLSESEEGERTLGLDIIPGRVVRLTGAPRSIHIGWNTVNPRKTNDSLPSQGYAYFVHAYACQPVKAKTVIGQTTYGVTFASMVRSGNVIGVQFHPEKSQEFGLSILKKFADGSV